MVYFENGVKTLEAAAKQKSQVYHNWEIMNIKTVTINWKTCTFLKKESNCGLSPE